MAGKEARWVPTSHLSCRSWPGPPRTHWPSRCLVLAAGSWRVPPCLRCWLSSPGSCCWSWGRWSAGAAVLRPGRLGRHQPAGEAGGAGAQSAVSRLLLPLPSFSPTCPPPPGRDVSVAVDAASGPRGHGPPATRRFQDGGILHGFCDQRLAGLWEREPRTVGPCGPVLRAVLEVGQAFHPRSASGKQRPGGRRVTLLRSLQRHGVTWPSLAAESADSGQTRTRGYKSWLLHLLSCVTWTSALAPLRLLLSYYWGALKTCLLGLLQRVNG